MNVVIAADLTANKIGSAETSLFTVARRLEAQGAAVQVWLSGSLAEPVRAYFAPAPEQVVTDIGGLADGAARARWLRMLAASPPDVLWLNFFPITGKFIRQLRRACPTTRICVTERISRGKPPANPLKAVWRRVRAHWTRKCIDQFIAVSRFIGQRLREVDHIPAERIEVVYHGIDLERFTPLPTAGTYLAAVCHMRAPKGIPVLLHALAILQRQGLRPECRLVGAGPELAAYETEARALGLTNVRFLGLRDDVPDVLRGAALTIVPSLWPEAFGLAAAESQAAGVPVIAAQVGGLAEVVSDGVSGLLVPPGDPAALASAIAALLADPERRRRMGRAGRRRAEEHFDLATQAATIARILMGSRVARRAAAPAFTVA